MAGGILLRYRNRIDLTRRITLGVIFMPKHEQGLKICVAGDTDDNEQQ
jgi:hypothetical protein|nr:MAG TPA: hypothetical protein [Caudoviricetes sp.]DAW52387.1 MAG TPA: hypothetical protein [Caudoviricetes sp.]DAW92359.1 MAG TPA: hypothetical protein [Bacteriophage sp.]